MGVRALRLVGAAAMGCLALAAPHAAEARRLVEAGDLLVGTGDAIWVVRADGGGIAPLSPRPGSGENLLELVVGVGVDAARERVLVADATGTLVLIDPEDGSQTRVEDDQGEALAIGDALTALEVLQDGSLLVCSVESEVEDEETTYGGRIYQVSAPDDEGRAVATPRSEPLVSSLPFEPLFGLAAAEPSPGDVQILVTMFSPLPVPLLTVGADGTVDLLPGTPIGEGTLALEPDVDCSAGSEEQCVFYWTETALGVDGCTSSSIVRADAEGTKAILSGAPLHCPIAVEAAPGGEHVFVVDSDIFSGESHVYRLDRDAENDTFTPVPIADSSQLPESDALLFPVLAISPIAMPEPVTGGEMAALGALVWRATRRRLAARRRAHDGGACRRPPPSA
jgi:hypothetical protein